MLATVILLKLIDATLGLRVGIDEELLVRLRPPTLLSSPIPSPPHALFVSTCARRIQSCGGAAQTTSASCAACLPFGTVRGEEAWRR